MPLPSAFLDAFDGPPTTKFNVCCAVPGPVNGPSSLGTISIKKSNWSDFDKAFEISARESVRRLLESAIMKARAVISDIKTGVLHETQYRASEAEYKLSQALQKRIGAKKIRVINRSSQSSIKHVYRLQQSSTT